MSRISSKLRRSTWLATLLALGACGAAYADDSSMSRFGGESYRYFNKPVVTANADAVAWRRAHPNGLTERELVALSSSGLSAAGAALDPPAFSNVAADTTWRQTHPSGFTEREFQALSASSLAQWHVADDVSASGEQRNVARDAGTRMLLARLKTFLSPAYGVRASPQ